MSDSLLKDVEKIIQRTWLTRFVNSSESPIHLLVVQAYNSNLEEKESVMKQFEHGACIWDSTDQRTKDQYRLFRQVFSWSPDTCTQPAVLKIAADSTFGAWINGKRCPLAQVADMPKDRTYSQLDVTSYLQDGTNTLLVEVHYLGDNFLTYRRGTPFLWAVITAGQQVLVQTDDSWQTCVHPAYQSGNASKLSEQLGYVFCYDARKQAFAHEPEAETCHWEQAMILPNTEDWLLSPRAVPQLQELPLPATAMVQYGLLRRNPQAAEESFALSCMTDALFPQTSEICFAEMDTEQYIDGYYRQKLKLSPDEHAHPFVYRQLTAEDDANGYYVIVDLGHESVGLPYFRVTAPAGTVVDLAHGEHLDDGRVRAFCHGRLFADRYICHEGVNQFVGLHRRMGLRYLELHFTRVGSGSVTLHYAGIIPLELPLPAPAAFETEDRLLQRTNQVSIDTLKLCMHEHYEDCPWREQGLYAYDSRNQMLYGYYVWGNYDFAGACLNLLGKSFDGDRYLSLTSPGLASITIPIFTMVWVTALYEHWMHSGSSVLFERWNHQVDIILDRALAHPDPATPGLYHSGLGKKFWNFCEWNGMMGKLEGPSQAPYNVYLCESLNSAARMHRMSGHDARAEQLEHCAQQLGKVIEQTFYNESTQVYDSLPPHTFKDGETGYEHLQMIMLTNNLVPQAKFQPLLNALKQKRLRGIDLSALRYLVCGLTNAGGPEGRRFLVNYLQEILDPIILSGATSLWETRHGSDDFDYAGSLCHAWSSVMPYVCGSLILGVKPLEPGFKRFTVKPYHAGLTHADGQIPTPYGMIRVRWQRTPEGAMDVCVTHPQGTTPVPESFPECPIGTFQSCVK